MAESTQQPGWDERGAPGKSRAVARRRGPDLLMLVVGALSLAMSVAAFVGYERGVPSLVGFDARWLLAAGATLIGLLLLVGSLRGRGAG